MNGSAIDRVTITSDLPAGRFGGIAYRHVRGIVGGQVALDEPVAGLRTAAAGRVALPYAVAFELVTPTDPGAGRQAVLVEAENRGSGVLLGSLHGIARTPLGRAGEGHGSGFLFAHGLSYARVQWQAGVAADVPADAQGVGEVILRDFGRLLGGGIPVAGTSLPVFAHRLLAGVSQGAWMVNSVIAEGFNGDPRDGCPVYQAAFTRNGGGNVLAINAHAGGGVHAPYLPIEVAPLTPAALLTRPESDPALVDILSYSDFYRLRASVFAAAPAPEAARLWRYATAAAHAPAGLLPAAAVFGALNCNGGVPIALNPIDDGPYVRALLLGLWQEIGVAVAGASPLPLSASFVLEPAGVGDGINALAGTALMLPRVDGDGMPVGGIAIPDVRHPIGRPVPPALGPVTTRSITEVCGNFGGWAPFTAAMLAERYGSCAQYVAGVTAALEELCVAGFVLVAEEAAIVATLAERYADAE